MAHSRRQKSSPNTGKRQIAAKQAVKRKLQKGASKHKNDELRVELDSQNQSLYTAAVCCPFKVLSLKIADSSCYQITEVPQPAAASIPTDSLQHIRMITAGLNGL